MLKAEREAAAKREAELQQQLDEARDGMLAARTERGRAVDQNKPLTAENADLKQKLQAIVPHINTLFGACEVTQSAGSAFKLQQASEVFTAMSAIRSVLMLDKK